MSVYPSIYTYSDLGAAPYTLIAPAAILDDLYLTAAYTPIDSAIASFDITQYCAGLTGTDGGGGGGGAGGGGGFTLGGEGFGIETGGVSGGEDNNGDLGNNVPLTDAQK